MNDWVLPCARSIALEKVIRSRSRIQQVRTGSSDSGCPRPAEWADLAAHGARVRSSAASSSARIVPCLTQSCVACTVGSSIIAVEFGVSARFLQLQFARDL